MANPHEQLLEVIAEGNFNEGKRLVPSGIDLNVPFVEGALVLYSAILSSEVSLVELMLEHGADPNFVADEPAASMYK
jgi:ankyrin repeat protein